MSGCQEKSVSEEQAWLTTWRGRNAPQGERKSAFWWGSVSIPPLSCSCAVMSWLLVTPWTVACQAPLSVGFSRQEYWRGLPFLTPGGLPDPGTKPSSLCLLHWQAGSSPLCQLGSPSMSSIGGIFGFLSLATKPWSMGQWDQDPPGAFQNCSLRSLLTKEKPAN